MQYHRLSLRFHLPKAPPYFIGSQIRGALGHALKQTVCVHPLMECKGCFAAENCLYYDWYEKSGTYHPFRLDFELGKPYYDFTLYLFGDAVAKLPYVVSALHRMLTRTGLGVERHRTDKFEFFVNGLSAWRDGHFTMPETSPQQLDIPSEPTPSRIKLTFVTPLRIKYQNRFVRQMDQLHLPTLIRSVYQREQALLGFPPSKLPFRVEGEITDRFGTFQDLTRFSYRQQGKLRVGGMMGEITLEGLDDASYQILQKAQILGMGKQTVFGLGKVKVDTL